MSASAEYAIEVAATLTGTETLGQMDALAASLVGASKDADFFRDALRSVEVELRAAKEATTAANTALGAGRAGYAELERAALQTAKAAERAGLKNKGVVPAELAAQAASAALAVEHQAAAMRGLEASAKGANEKETALAATMKNLATLNGHATRSIAEQERALKEAKKGFAGIGGPIGGVASKLLNLREDFADVSGAAGTETAVLTVLASTLAAVGVAVVAVTAALIAGTIAIAAYAVGLADSKRSATLAQEAFDEMNPSLAGLSKNFAALTAETGLTAPQLDALAKQLKAAKVTAADLPGALRAAALAEAGLGAGGGAEFVASLQNGKKAVGALAAEAQAKLGPIVAKQMLGLTGAGALLKRNFSGIFDGLNIEPLLEGLHTLVQLFDASSASGSALKFLFETIFQPIVDGAAGAAVSIEAFVLGLEIGLVRMYIALKPTIKAVREFFGVKDEGLGDSLLSAKMFGEALAPVLVACAVAVGLLAAAVGVALVGAMIILLPLWIAIGAAIAVVTGAVWLAVVAWNAVVGAFDAAVSWITGFDIKGVGSAIMTGMVSGILGGGAAVFDAITGVVRGAINGAKKLLGIASPSKVFADIGVNTALGFGAGVDDAAPDAHAAVQDLVSPKSALAGLPPVAAVSFGASTSGGGASTSGGGASASGGRPLIDLSGATFRFEGVENAEDAWSIFSERMTRLLEGDATALGAPSGAD